MDGLIDGLQVVKRIAGAACASGYLSDCQTSDNLEHRPVSLSDWVAGSGTNTRGGECRAQDHFQRHQGAPVRDHAQGASTILAPFLSKNILDSLMGRV